MSKLDSILGRYAFAMKQDKKREENHQKAKREIAVLFEEILQRQMIRAHKELEEMLGANDE